ncbi:MAG: NHLP bacteriocin system secretion protein [Thermoanaerobaculia bacterium]
MAKADKIFRKAALEKLSSPERLDVLMEVTSPAGWLALSALGVVIALVIVWSFYGTIGTKVGGQGILLRGGSVLQVTSDTQGRITKLYVAPGENVEAGMVVADIAQDDYKLKIDNQKALLADLVRQNDTLSTTGLESSLEEKIKAQTTLVSRGLLTKSDLMATMEQLASLRRQAASRATQIDQLRRQIGEMEMQMVNASRITSPYSGRVLEVGTGVGELIAPGMRVFTLEPPRAPIDVVLYVPAAEGKKIKPGMEARISPSTVKAEEFGFMIGRVTGVSDFPVTPDGLQKVLRNDSLVQQLAGQGAPIEVKVRLTPDKNTPSGFKWSSSLGPPVKVATGTLCVGTVVVAEKKPISYILPIFKSAAGM